MIFVREPPNAAGACHRAVSGAISPRGGQSSSFYPHNARLEVRFWDRNAALLRIRGGDSVLWFSVCAGGPPAFVSHVTYYCRVSHFCAFYLILEIGHRNRAEGGCLKTHYDDSFSPPLCEETEFVCTHISMPHDFYVQPKVMLDMIIPSCKTALDCRIDVRTVVYF